MPITFNNVTIDKNLLLLDEALREAASAERFADKIAEIRVVMAEERFSYYVLAHPIGRGLSITVLLSERFQLCLSWGGGAFVCRAMTAEEVKEQLVVLLNFLVDGILPEMIDTTKNEFVHIDKASSTTES